MASTARFVSLISSLTTSTSMHSSVNSTLKVLKLIKGSLQMVLPLILHLREPTKWYTSPMITLHWSHARTTSLWDLPSSLRSTVSLTWSLCFQLNTTWHTLKMKRGLGLKLDRQLNNKLLKPTNLWPFSALILCTVTSQPIWCNTWHRMLTKDPYSLLSCQRMLLLNPYTQKM